MWLLQASVCSIYKDGIDSEFVRKAGLLDTNVSLIWGIWHFVDIISIISQGGGCPVGFVGEALIEFLEPIQDGATMLKQPELALVLVVIRAISAIVAGAARL
jgi:hypothetical protein